MNKKAVLLYSFIVFTSHTQIFAGPSMVKSINGGSFGSCDRLKVGNSRIVDGKVQFCNGTEWKGVFAETTGKVCTTSQKGRYSMSGDNLEFCDGSTWLTTGNKILTSCSTDQRGKFRFDTDPTGVSSEKVMQFCNGSNWLDLSTKTSSTPIIFSCTRPEIAGLPPVCSEDGTYYQDKYDMECAGKAESKSLIPNPATMTCSSNCAGKPMTLLVCSEEGILFCNMYDLEAAGKSNGAGIYKLEFIGSNATCKKVTGEIILTAEPKPEIE